VGSEPTDIEDQGRRAERHALDEAARLRPNSWSSVEIRMVDLSALGFRAACEARLQSGGTVSLEIPGVGAIEAQVEWQRRGEFGARFYQPIDLGSCRWAMEDQHRTLAHLLVQRAGASRAGRDCADRQLRRQILGALPMRKAGLTG
jgi:hypothetical protein